MNETAQQQISDVNKKKDEFKIELAKEVKAYHLKINALNNLEDQYGILDERIGLDEKEREIADRTRKMK